MNHREEVNRIYSIYTEFIKEYSQSCSLAPKVKISFGKYIESKYRATEGEETGDKNQTPEEEEACKLIEEIKEAQSSDDIGKFEVVNLLSLTRESIINVGKALHPDSNKDKFKDALAKVTGLYKAILSEEFCLELNLEDVGDIKPSQDFSEILSSITENKKNNEKVNGYINGCFCNLLYRYIKKRNGEKCIARYILSLKTELFQKWQKAESASVSRLQNAGDVDIFLHNLDVDGWCAVAKKRDGKSLVDTKAWNILSKLKKYRNRVQHNFLEQVDDDCLLQTIYYVMKFADFAGYNQEKLLLEKRYAFEIERHAKTKVSHYYEASLARMVNSLEQDVPCWKDCVWYKGEAVADLTTIASAVNSLFCRTPNCESSAISPIAEYYTQNAIMFPVDLSKNLDRFSNLVEESYPFHPAFFEVMKAFGLNEEDQRQMLVSIVSRDMADEKYNATLIMPYEIVTRDLVPTHIIKYYSLTDLTRRADGDVDKIHEYGWRFLYDMVFDSKSPLLRLLALRARKSNPDQCCIDENFASNLLKTLQLLDQSKDKNGSSRDWIRYMMASPGVNMLAVENILPLVPSVLKSFVFENAHGDFSFFRPIDYRDYINSIFDEEFDIRHSESKQKNYIISTLKKECYVPMMAALCALSLDDSSYPKKKAEIEKDLASFQSLIHDIEEDYKFMARYQAYVLAEPEKPVFT